MCAAYILWNIYKCICHLTFRFAGEIIQINQNKKSDMKSRFSSNKKRKLYLRNFLSHPFIRFSFFGSSCVNSSEKLVQKSISLKNCSDFNLLCIAFGSRSNVISSFRRINSVACNLWRASPFNSIIRRIYDIYYNTYIKTSVYTSCSWRGPPMAQPASVCVAHFVLMLDNDESSSKQQPNYGNAISTIIWLAFLFYVRIFAKSIYRIMSDGG